MRSFRFLLSRRWVLFALSVVVVACATWWLGQWQFHRLHDRKADNRVVETNERRAAAPIQEVLTAGRSVAGDDEWRLVTVTGTYDPAHEIQVRGRTVASTVGFEIVTPLRLADGTAVLIDRGWVPPAQGGAAAAPIARRVLQAALRR